jgi:signal transduction histidine kinase
MKWRPKRYTTFVMMLIIWAGVAGSLFAAISTDLRNRDFLQGRAVSIADALPTYEITALDGNLNDLGNPAYNDLKYRLQKVRHDQADLRFAFLMGQDGDRIFLYADSETPGTSNYSDPGDSYSEASPKLKHALKSSEPFVEGPRRDHLGTWVTASAPVIDPKNGETLAVVGIGIDAISYYQRIALFSIIPLLLAAIPLAGLIRDRQLEIKEHEIAELKKQFVSIASHELRSPLNGMLWAIQSLLRDDKDMTKEQQEMLLDMYRSTEASMATVNEILDLSIFERGQAHNLQSEQVDLTTIIQQVVSTLKLTASEKDITIKQVGKWPEQIVTMGDVSALKRSFMNLISNAIKYSLNGGEVEITYRHSGQEHIVAIRDHGIGIPAEEQDKVLNGYYRATNATRQQAHGTGLGLWLARMIVEQHKGRLWINSVEDLGTTIYLALPATSTKITGRDQS